MGSVRPKSNSRLFLWHYNATRCGATILGNYSVTGTNNANTFLFHFMLPSSTVRHNFNFTVQPVEKGRKKGCHHWLSVIDGHSLSFLSRFPMSPSFSLPVTGWVSNFLYLSLSLSRTLCQGFPTSLSITENHPDFRLSLSPSSSLLSEP